MRLHTGWVALAACTAALLGASGIAAAHAQTAQIGALTGNATQGKQLYVRFCIGCHGVNGDGNGENAPWIEPKPRDFTAAVFKCRSTPTGTLPTDQDLYNSVTRGFVNTGMPSWNPLMDQTRADLVAYIKTFSPRFAAEKPGAALVIPPETPITKASVLHGRELFTKMECWKCHGPAGQHSHRQQGHADPALQFLLRHALEVRFHEHRSLPHLHDRRRWDADAVLRRQPDAGRRVGPRALPPHAAAGQGRRGGHLARMAPVRSGALGHRRPLTYSSSFTDIPL
jgi:mono/diheme cytochrome c family protein